MRNFFLFVAVISASIVGCFSLCGDLEDREACCANNTCAWANCSDTGSLTCVEATELETGGSCADRGNQCLEADATSAEPATGVTESGATTTAPEGATGTAGTDATTSGGGGGGSTASNAPEPTTGEAGSTSPTIEASTDAGSDDGHCHCSRKFDAWSFVGGMILVGGIVLITFLGVKYYRSKTEQRYHQF